MPHHTHRSVHTRQLGEFVMSRQGQHNAGPRTLRRLPSAQRRRNNLPAPGGRPCARGAHRRRSGRGWPAAPGRGLAGAATVVVLAFLALLTGCTTRQAGHPVPAGSPGSSSAGEPAKTPPPKDRDLQAVTVALRQLDACGVFDLDAAKTTTPGAAVLPTGPHSCMLTPRADYSPADDGVRVAVGAEFSHLVAYGGAPVTIGGAKAYEYRQDGAGKRCELYVPVSFTRALRYTYDAYDNTTDTCRVLHDVAQASVAKLRAPEAITVNPAQRPYAAWDGCYFLATLLDQDAKNYTYKPDGLYDPFSGCDTTKKTDGGAPSHEYTPKLEIAYEQTPKAAAHPRPVGGKTADVDDFTGSCRLTWNQGESHTASQWYAALVIKLTTATCDTTAKLAEKAIALIDQAPDDADAAPQRPLLLAPDDPDTEAVGACRDFGPGQYDCEPYHPVDVPQGTEQILTAALTNRNVQCAVFADAVATLFGSTFAALTWGEHCFWVEPTHSLELRVNVDAENVPGDFGKRQDLWTDRQETQIAGKAAVTFWGIDKNDFDVYLSPFNDLSRPGNLHINIQALNTRGTIMDERAKLDPAKAQAAIQAITQITQKYFAQ
ncbi:DUF3558 family protein, partial [Actinophytocola sp.]|uniref:DUF3558 family protein n=1 Tax=Actinophytocola sp. TaxID=1872138 RepID=UPI002D8097AF